MFKLVIIFRGVIALYKTIKITVHKSNSKEGVGGVVSVPGEIFR